MEAAEAEALPFLLEQQALSAALPEQAAPSVAVAEAEADLEEQQLLEAEAEAVLEAQQLLPSPDFSLIVDGATFTN